MSQRETPSVVGRFSPQPHVTQSSLAPSPYLRVCFFITLRSHCTFVKLWRNQAKTTMILLYAAFLKAYPSKPKQQSQKEFNLKWNELKSDKANLQKNVDSLMIEYRDISLKHTGKLMSYWSTLPKQNVSTASAHPPESLPLEFLPDSDQFIEKNDDGHAIPSQSFASASGSQIPPTKRTIYETKAQDHLKTQIDLINSDLVGLYKRRDSGFITEEQEKEIKSKKIKLHGLDLELKKKVREQERQKKIQGNQKRKPCQAL